MKRIIFIISALLIVLLAACTGGAAETGELEVTDVWGRTSPMAAANGAFYMTVANNTGEDDALISASSDACGTTELHEMYMKENDVMGMRPVPGGSIPVPAGETVELKVGGLHVMCLDKQAEFNAGDQFEITLQFENAGEMVVTAEIRDMADGNMDMEGGDMNMEEGDGS
ncbi:MAG: copper chaperone PCu(A)C [Anaerolineales bacterium]|nr:copper chaperone PCu(A)C [Anaerolineales bacterium]